MVPRRLSLGLVILFFSVLFVEAEPSVLDRFPRGVGFNGGLSSGVGLSYRELSSVGGFQVTGIVFKSDSPGTSSAINYSAGFGLLKPVGGYRLSSWLHLAPYFQGSLNSIGTVTLPGQTSVFSDSAPSFIGAVSLGVSGGLEWLLWDHFSFNLEVANSFGVEFPSRRSGPWDIRPYLMVFPQAAWYFRF